MTSGLALLTHWFVRQKVNRVSSVWLRRSIRSFTSCCLELRTAWIQNVAHINFVAYLISVCVFNGNKTHRAHERP